MIIKCNEYIHKCKKIDINVINSFKEKYSELLNNWVKKNVEKKKFMKHQ